MKPINVGLIGIGTVGGGTWNVLKRNADEISRRAGRPIRITAVADKNVELAKQVTGGAARVTDDAFSLVNDPEIDIIVELIGGYGVAREVVMQAIANGKHVVTANKALLAVHGTEIFTAAQQKGVMVAFEAAVAGGIPIIKALREGLSANRIEWAAGIINGTTNFILSEMRDKGLSFDDVLKEAQRLGYAEADPTFDIEGVDAAHWQHCSRRVSTAPVWSARALINSLAITSITSSPCATSRRWSAQHYPRLTKCLPGTSRIRLARRNLLHSVRPCRRCMSGSSCLC